MGRSYSVVVPTVGRPTLRPLLAGLAAARGPLDLPAWPRLQLVPGGGRGPAAARNAGWRATTTPWVAFLDDDVLVGPDWPARLAADLAGLPAGVAGSQGRLRVPLPADRQPTDWERGTAGLADAWWATADMAFRRPALVRVDGFDERFRRAYREDAEIALRLLDAGFSLVRGSREVTHPVRPEPRWASVRAQRGNADDALVRRLHGRGWRARAGAPRGRFPRHLAVTAAGAAALAGATRLAGRSGPGGGSRPRWPWVAAAGWLLGTAEFAAARIAPGPRTPGEVARMLVSSAAIPPVAVAYRLGGELAHRRARPTPAESVESVESVEPAASVGSVPPLAVLFDRDGTLIDDVPYNGDPELVRPLPGALAALTRLRAGGVPVGVVTNQSAVGRGLLTAADVARVNARVEELLGPFDSWQVCPHAPGDGCGCRKPAPGLVLAAAAELGVPPQRCVLVGDIGADLAAARAAGARAVLVPTAVTRPEEVAAAAAVAPDLPAAVELALAGGAR